MNLIPGLGADDRRSSACIVNLSPGGFCLSSSRPGNPGAQVLLCIQDHNGQQVTVTDRCRWQAETDATPKALNIVAQGKRV